MKIALVSGTSNRTPPVATGPYELFVSELAEGLVSRGHEVVLFASGDSITSADLRALHPKPLNHLIGETPELEGEVRDLLMSELEMQFTSWALSRARELRPDIVHTQWPHYIPILSGMDPNIPHVITHHHGYGDGVDPRPFCARQSQFLDVRNLHVVAVAKFQQTYFPSSVATHLVPHGLDYTHFTVGQGGRSYLLALGRVCPAKGTHIAIEVAKKANLPLIIAGTIDAQEYFDAMIAPYLDGTNIRYVGEADFTTKIELYGGAIAHLFPICWDEPFGLTQLESMACGTPVLALRRGAAPDVVRDGVSGYVVDSAEEMVARIAEAARLSPTSIRRYVEENFSRSRMLDGYERVYRAACRA